MPTKPMSQKDAERIARTTHDPDFAQRARQAAVRNDPLPDFWEEEEERQEQKE